MPLDKGGLTCNFSSIKNAYKRVNSLKKSTPWNILNVGEEAFKLLNMLLFDKLWAFR